MIAPNNARYVLWCNSISTIHRMYADRLIPLDAASWLTISAVCRGSRTSTVTHSLLAVPIPP